MKPPSVSKADVRRIWLHAQRLDVREPFGAGPSATLAAIGHLGYVQIDTINVIERCHHHILYNRIPSYRRGDLKQLQSVDKSVFEYWTHALAYVPVTHFAFYLPQMRQRAVGWNQRVDRKDYRRVIRLIRKDGAITIRDIEDDVLVEKEFLWASRKPSKAALQLAFWNGILTISEREGMLKTYELTDRHFGWTVWPKPATTRQVLDHLIDTALRSQGVVSIDSIRHTRRNLIAPLTKLLEGRVRRKELVPVTVEGVGTVKHWAAPETIEAIFEPREELVHILSPFDPLVRLRKRTALFFDYEHLFEAYVPKEKRKFGYFTLPVLVGDIVEAMVDLKIDRAGKKLLVQSWHWTGKGNKSLRARIEGELHRFEAFQLGAD